METITLELPTEHYVWLRQQAIDHSLETAATIQVDIMSPDKYLAFLVDCLYRGNEVPLYEDDFDPEEDDIYEEE